LAKKENNFDAFIERVRQQKAAKPDIKQTYKDFVAYREQQSASEEITPKKGKPPKQPEEDFLL
jgi:hypothetical protein